MIGSRIKVHWEGRRGRGDGRRG